MPSGMHRHHASGQVRALVVDDDPIMRNLVRTRLSGMVDEVVEAGDGHDAWHILGRREFHIALVDLGMPNLNGFALIQCMRGHPRTRHMPIIVISANDDRTSIERALGAGASAFLPKPLSWGSFGALIEHLIRLSASAANASIRSSHLQALVTSQGKMAAALASQTRTNLRRVAAAAAQGASDAKLREELQTAQSSAERLASIAALLSPTEVIDSQGSPAGEMLKTACEAAADVLDKHGVSLRAPDLKVVELAAARGAMIAAWTAAIVQLAQHAAQGSVLDIIPTMAPEQFTLRFVLTSGSLDGITAEDRRIDLPMAAKLPRAHTALELALIALLIEAHGGSLELIEKEGKVAGLALHLPSDRTWLSSMIVGPDLDENPTADEDSAADLSKRLAATHHHAQSPHSPRRVSQADIASP